MKKRMNYNGTQKYDIFRPALISIYDYTVILFTCKVFFLVPVHLSIPEHFLAFRPFYSSRDEFGLQPHKLVYMNHDILIIISESGIEQRATKRL